MSSTDRAHKTPPDALDLPFTIDNLHALRTAAAGKAHQLGATDTIVPILQLVVSELAANAIRHGGGHGRLRLWNSETVLYCQVSDNGPGLTDHTADTALPQPTDDQGRGLWIVRQLASSLAVNPGPDGTGTVVTATLPNGHHHTP